MHPATRSSTNGLHSSGVVASPSNGTPSQHQHTNGVTNGHKEKDTRVTDWIDKELASLGVTLRVNVVYKTDHICYLQQLGDDEYVIEDEKKSMPCILNQAIKPRFKHNEAHVIKLKSYVYTSKFSNLNKVSAYNEFRRYVLCAKF